MAHVKMANVNHVGGHAYLSNDTILHTHANVIKRAPDKLPWGKRQTHQNLSLQQCSMPSHQDNTNHAALRESFTTLRLFR